MKANILGVLIDKLNIYEVLEKIDVFLRDGKKHYIVTPNPEFLMQAKEDEEFKNILNLADIAVPDGFGLLLASSWLGDRIKKRVTGVDLVWQLCRKINNTDYKIFLLGGGVGVAREAGEKLKKSFSGLRVVGAEEGMERREFQLTNPELIKKINDASPDIIFVAFGHGKQEKWIYYNLPKLNSVKIAIGVGGTLDYLSERVRRAPNILRRWGFEWLWRFFKEPWRWKRIYRATILFPLTVLKYKR